MLTTRKLTESIRITVVKKHDSSNNYKAIAKDFKIIDPTDGIFFLNKS